MKVYLLKAFDISNFRTFTPSPAGFIHKEAAEEFCDTHAGEEGEIYYAYEEVEISEAERIES